MTRILVAVDGSSHSAKVAKAVIRHVSAFKEPVRLARCPVVLVRE